MLTAEDTRRFLDKLAAAAAATTQPAQTAGRMDAAVDGTLAHIAHVRREFARAREAEKKAAEEALRKKREDEENRRRREQEASRRAEEEKAEASRRQTAQKAADRQAAAERRQAKHVSPEAQAWADKYRAQYAELRSGLAVRVRQNAALKAYSFRQRGLITRSFGQLKDSMEFVRRVAQTVGDAVADGEREHGADGRRWLLNLAAKALVSQAETEVAVAQPSAYPLAAATVLLAQRFADLPDLLILRLVKKCPLSVP
ncbi:Nuclear pore complex nucleoporin component, partial [Coemansia sp. RSA 2607]